MTDREKLVKLMRDVAIEMRAEFGEMFYLIKPENLADHLIANGVTVDDDCKACAEATQECIVGLQEKIAEMRKKLEWISVEDRLPKSGEHVLLCCEVRRSDGSAVKRYVCDGFFAAKHTETVFYSGDDVACEYSEKDDEYYLMEGWYEVIKNWDDYNSIVISDFVVGWMPLPETPKEEEHATD